VNIKKSVFANITHPSIRLYKPYTLSQHPYVAIQRRKFSINVTQ